MDFAVGQSWHYRAPDEIAHSRIVIGALVAFAGDRTIACCAVTVALQKRADGSYDRVEVPFLPLTLEALETTVTELDGEGVVPDAFAAQFEAWHDDPKGQSYFTVPFEGSLELMIGHQMAAIIGDE